MEGLRTRLGETWAPKLQNALAMAHGNRGVALSNLNQLAAAVAAQGRIIKLMKAYAYIRARPWPRTSSMVALAFMNRGDTLRKLHQPAEAIADEGRAIES